METFIEDILNGKKSKRSMVDQLYKKPLKENKNEKPTIPIINPNYAHYIDLLYLPNDNGMKYCVVIVDQGSRYVGATALEDRSVSDVIGAIKLIYRKSKFLKTPEILISDAGKEFLKNFKSEILKLGIKHHKITKVGRHRSILAERKNQTIGKVISKVLTQVQLSSGNPSSKWVSYLPTIIKVINLKVNEQNIKPTKMEDVQPFKFDRSRKIKMLKVGDKVRVALDNPVDVVGNTLHGKFRTGDIRWNTKVRTVKYIYMKPDQPIMYFLDGNHGDLKIETVGYTINQLQKVSKQEKDQGNVVPLFENDLDRHEVQKVLERGINEDDEIMYLVKFKRIRKAVWIKRESLVTDLGVSFMKKLDKLFDKN